MPAAQRHEHFVKGSAYDITTDICFYSAFTKQIFGKGGHAALTNTAVLKQTNPDFGAIDDGSCPGSDSFQNCETFSVQNLVNPNF